MVLAHGLEGSPEGRRASALRAAGLQLEAPDGRGLPLAPRVAGIIEAIAAHPGAVLVGSSYGGLAALAVVDRLGIEAQISGLVLLAPALSWSEPPVEDPEALIVPRGVPATVLHGVHDRIVPIEVSRRLSARCPHIQLIERDDDHRLARSLDVMVATVKNYLR
ncbi:MAG TPA: hypothetical protein ENK18_04840 [Deltaproteobacteria bacterium]|nr:hypothetical protein [Deltaproteobacteria bacterium]